MAEFIYQEPFPLSEDTTEYRLLTKDYVETVECDGRRILKVAPEGLELLAREAIADVSFYLRASHLQKLTRILDDPEATSSSPTRCCSIRRSPPRASCRPVRIPVRPS